MVDILFQKFQTDFAGYVNIEVYRKINDDLFAAKCNTPDGIMLGTKQINAEFTKHCSYS